MATKTPTTVPSDPTDVGCSDDCKSIETGWECPTWGSACRRICSNGLGNAGEQCDDKNLDSNDGCSSTCQIESGYKFKAWGEMW